MVNHSRTLAMDALKLEIRQMEPAGYALKSSVLTREQVNTAAKQQIHLELLTPAQTTTLNRYQKKKHLKKSLQKPLDSIPDWKIVPLRRANKFCYVAE